MAISIGERIRRARKAAGLTQKALGEKCNMPDSQIRQYELGMVSPRLEQLERITNALDITVDALYYDYLSPEEYEKDHKENSISFNDKNFAKIISALIKLNDTGRAEAAKRVSELTEIKKYTKKHNVE